MQFECEADKRAYVDFITLFPQFKHTKEHFSHCRNEHLAYKCRVKQVLRRWREQQATPKGCRSGVISRYRAIHARHLTVDHIVPLQGVNAAGDHIVCGLNVAWNLQGQTAEENCKKGNLFVDNKNSLAIIVAVVNKQQREKRLQITVD